MINTSLTHNVRVMHAKVVPQQCFLYSTVSWQAGSKGGLCCKCECARGPLMDSPAWPAESCIKRQPKLIFRALIIFIIKCIFIFPKVSWQLELNWLSKLPSILRLAGLGPVNIYLRFWGYLNDQMNSK